MGYINHIKCLLRTPASLIAKIKTTKGSQSLETTIAAMKSNRVEKQRLIEALDALEYSDHTPTKL